MRSVLLYRTQDDWENQRVSAAEQERTIAGLSRRAPLYARAPTRIDLADGRWDNLLRYNSEFVKSTPLLVYIFLLEFSNFCYTLLNFTNGRIDSNAPKASKDYRKCIRVEKTVEKHNEIYNPSCQLVVSCKSMGYPL